LDEVNYLSNKNAELEELIVGMPNIKDSIGTLKRQNGVLLALLGEKEEELEAALGDMKEIKNLYQSQIQELTDRILAFTSLKANVTE
jgi:hypothetical protein